MSSYPPPPPPGQYPPPFDRNAWRAQQRMVQAQQRAAAAQQKAQWRMQRAQLRAQSRMARRGSLVGPLLLITLGVIFLLTQTGALEWSTVASWYAHWWPAVLIGAGVLLLIEWAIGRERSPGGSIVLGGGLVFLLILLASVGWSLRFVDGGRAWSNHFLGSDWSRMMGDAHEADSSSDAPLTSGQTLIVRLPHGDITLTGSSSDGRVHVSTHKQVYAWKDSEAESKFRHMEPAFDSSNGQLVLSVNAIDGGTADLTIEAPHDVPVVIESTHGDVSVSQLHAPLNVTSNHGDVELNAVNGAVDVQVHNDDASISGHSMTGSVTVEGHAGDMSFSDIDGGVTMHGDFFGSTHLEHVHGAVRFRTSRTQFEAARLDGELDIASGEDFSADQLLGPVTLATSNRNITLDRVQGKVTVTNRNGPVNITAASPLDSIQVNNQKGSVDVGLPEKAGFVLNATTRHGEMENDFGLSNSGSDDHPEIRGTISSGGPQVSIETSDGDVTVRKSSVAPLPPAPPAPPKISTAPAPPKLPSAPKAPKAPSAPKAAPQSETF